MDASLPAKPKQSGVERSGFEQTVLLLQGGGALGSNIVHLIYNAAKSLHLLLGLQARCLAQRLPMLSLSRRRDGRRGNSRSGFL
jgi:hypothetical protein